MSSPFACPLTSEGISSKGKHSTAKTFYNKSESLCEEALEILQEILHYDSGLRVLFDRTLALKWVAI